MPTRAIDLHASWFGVARFHKTASAWCTEASTIAPSPTAEATRSIDPDRDRRCASASGVRVAPPRAVRRGLPVVRERAIAAADPDQMLVEVADRVLEPDVSTR
jgi:hypothetical protein